MPENDKSAFGEMNSTQLAVETIQAAMSLVRSEVALAKVELRADMESELAGVRGLGIAAVCAIVTVSLLTVSGALALAIVIPGWAAALSVAGVAAIPSAIFGVIGWKKLKVPLSRTRKSLVEDARWLKERTQ